MLEIPQIQNNKLKREDAINFIHKLCIRNGFSPLKTPSQIKLNFKNIYIKDTIEPLKKFAITKKGSLLSKNYIGRNEKLVWKCELGHTWEATPGNIMGNSSKKGTWCPTCAINDGRLKVKSCLNEAIKVANERKGECISKKYISSRSKLKWRCSKNHKWEATLENIKGNKSKKGTWCPQCQKLDAGKKRRDNTLRVLKKEISNEGGYCFTEEYTDVKTLLKIICSKGHYFEVYTWKYRRGYRCPKCVACSVRITRLLKTK